MSTFVLPTRQLHASNGLVCDIFNPNDEEIGTNIVVFQAFIWGGGEINSDMWGWKPSVRAWPDTFYLTPRTEDVDSADYGQWTSFPFKRFPPSSRPVSHGETSGGTLYRLFGGSPASMDQADHRGYFWRGTNGDLLKWYMLPQYWKKGGVFVLNEGEAMWFQRSVQPRQMATQMHCLMQHRMDPDARPLNASSPGI